MKTREIMTSRPDVIAAGDPIARAAQVMLIADIGFLPVVDDVARMHLVGVITDRDIAMRYVAQNRSPNTLVRDVMTSNPLVCVSPDDDVHDVMGRMRHQRVRRIAVVDKERRVLGVVAQADIARKLGPREPEAVEQLIEAISQPTPV